ncbi:MAG TPA: hypothetical protein VMM79_14545, partial [Longimicrobiales bacterium]|nr:hypothetical protein [Longimicrobiales bacterium]
MSGTGEAEVRSKLADWTKGLSTDDESERTWADLFLKWSEDCVSAGERGDTWDAIYSALHAGIALGRHGARIHVRGARLSGTAKTLVELYPDADSGQRSRAGWVKALDV